MKSTKIDLSDIPPDWEVIPCGYFFKEKSIKNNSGEINLSVYRDYGVIPRDSRDDNHNRISEDISNYKLVEEGDFVLNKMKCWMGSLGVSNYRGIVSPSYTVLQPKREIHNQYFHYLLRSEEYRQIYESLSYGVRVGQWELRFHDFKKIPALYPKINEQILIARYLDKKIQNINLLIKKIEKKIELLQNKKIILIDRYLKKGLDQNIFLKDSGIEWVGEIPNHWKIGKIKYIAKVNTGSTPSTTNKMFYENGKYLWIKPGDLNEFVPITDTEQKLTDLGLNCSREVDENSALICGIGDIGKFGFSKEKVTTNQQIHAISFNKEFIIPQYGILLVSSMREKLIQESEKVVVSILTKRKLESLEVFIPPIKEQEQIHLALDKIIFFSNEIINKEQKRIELLKEYRKSLISSVVTGKIRVTEGMI